MREIGTVRLGVREGPEVPYLARQVDEALEQALGSDVPLVVATGDALAGTSASMVRAARLMLGRSVVVPADELDIDVAALVTVAARHRAAIWLDGATVGVLDQLTPPLVATAEARGVRLVVTTRPEFVDADHPHDGTAELLERAIVASVGPLSEREAAAGGPYRGGDLVGRQILGPDGPLRSDSDDPVRAAVIDVVTSWEVLAVPAALTPERLVTAVAHELTDRRVTAWTERIIRAYLRRRRRRTRLGRALLVRDRRRGEVHLRPDPLLLGESGSRHGLVRLLVGLLSEQERRVVARTALALDDDATAGALLDGLDVGGLGAVNALRVARSYRGRPPAVPWYRHAIHHATGPVELLESRVELAELLDRRTGSAVDIGNDRAEAQRLMEAAVPDQRALLWLGRRTRRSGAISGTEARAWWLRAAAGVDVDLAAEAAWLVAEHDLAAGDDESAGTYLSQARASTGWWTRPVTIALGRLHRRHGRLDEAEAVLRPLLTDGPLADAEVVIELGQLAEARGDTAAARELYRRAVLSDEATLRLAELDLTTGEYDAVRQRIRSSRRAPDMWDDTPAWAWNDPDFRERSDRAWGCWLAGEAAYQLGDHSDALKWFEHAGGAPGRRSDHALLRRGQIELERGGVVPAYQLLLRLTEGTDEIAVAARRTIAPIEAEALRRIAAERAQPAYVGVLRNGRTRIVYDP